MDVLERAIRAAGLPARYSEGFNPHMKLSMGPALALGLESRHEVFDVEGIAPFPPDAAARIAEKLPPGISILEVRALGQGEPSLAKAVKGARYTVRLASDDQVSRAGDAVAEGWREAMPALRALSLEADASGASLRFEVNLDQAAGETATREEGARDAPRDPARGAGLDVGRPRGDRPRLMYRVTVSARFEAAHNLIDYEGGPEPLHGHSYNVEAVLEAEKLQRYDVAVDFVPAKRALEAIAKELDYTYINEHPAFRGRNTSAENLAAPLRRAAGGFGRPRLGAGRRGDRLGRAREPGDLEFGEIGFGRCGNGEYCPTSTTNRGQMATFLVKTFHLQ